jgi:hypothetical protein
VSVSVPSVDFLRTLRSLASGIQPYIMTRESGRGNCHEARLGRSPFGRPGDAVTAVGDYSPRMPISGARIRTERLVPSVRRSRPKRRGARATHAGLGADATHWLRDPEQSSLRERRCDSPENRSRFHQLRLRTSPIALTSTNIVIGQYRAMRYGNSG